MKRQIKRTFAIALATTLIGSTALAGGIQKDIKVFTNEVNVEFNGDKVDINNFLYNNTTYVPLRALSDMLGKKISWDQATNTASIEDETKEVKQFEYITEIDSTYEASQISERFPESNQTSRVLARSRRVFKAYENRGKLIIENHDAESAELYINGKLIDISDVLKDKTGKVTIDISKYTRDGDNTLKVLNVSPEGTYVNVNIPYPELVMGTPEESGFSTEKLEKIDAYINDEVEKGFPGAVLLVLKDGKVIKNTAYGYEKKYEGKELLDEFETMTTDTIFDMASNTKMFATNLAVQKLQSEGKLDYNDLISKYIPGFTGEGREKIKIKDVMTHSAGFAPVIDFFNPQNETGEEFYSIDREKTIKLLEKAPLVYETGTKSIYSDTDYILLGVVVEQITGQREDEYVEENIYKPLGLENTMFNPLEKGIDKEMIAATEIVGNTAEVGNSFPGERDYTIRGEVHDSKAYYSMGGVAGHAGLFSNTKDMAVLMQSILNKGGYGGVKLMDENVLEQYTKASDRSITTALGWRRAGDMNRIWHFGPYASSEAIGHTGWTGTVTVIDPKYDLAVVLLTNKKHSMNTDGTFVDGKFKMGKFEGDTFQTGRYGSIISMVYESFLEE